MLAQQITVSEMNSVTTGPGAQFSTTSGLHASDTTSVTTSVAPEVTFEDWSVTSPRLAAIAEVSGTIAGELPSFEAYVNERNSSVRLGDLKCYPCLPLSLSPSEVNYHDKLAATVRALAA